MLFEQEPPPNCAVETVLPLRTARSSSGALIARSTVIAVEVSFGKIRISLLAPQAEKPPRGGPPKVGMRQEIKQ
jgi:hypothetical protein